MIYFAAIILIMTLVLKITNKILTSKIRGR